MKRILQALLGAGGLLALAAQAGSVQDLQLALRISTAPPPACDGGPAISVPLGTPLNYCFTVTNQGSTPLRYHSLEVDERPLHTYDRRPAQLRRYLLDLPLAPGQSRNYHVSVVTGESFNPRFYWSAFADRPRYTLETAAPLDTVDISSSGQLLTGLGGMFPLPFDTVLFGRRFIAGKSMVCAYPNGVVQLVSYDWECGSGAQFFASDNESGFTPENYDSLLAHWDVFGAGGTLRFAVVGSAPQRRVVIDWHSRNHLLEEILGIACVVDPSVCGVSFQALLDEDGRISFSYTDLQFDGDGGDVFELDNGGSAMVGLVDFSRDLRQIHSNNAPALHNGQTLRWTPQQTVHTAEVDGRIEAGTPALRVDPAVLRADLFTGGPARNQALSLRNTGSLDLVWNLHEQVARPAPLPGSWGREHFVADAAAQPLTRSSAPPRGGAGAPAYILLRNYNGSPYRYFNTNDPFNDALVMQQTIDVHAGDFINDDFTRQLWLMDGPGSWEYGFGIFDTATGAIDYRGLAVYPIQEGRWRGMAWDRSSNTLYAMTSTCNTDVSGQRAVLYTLDPATGMATRLGPIEAGGNACFLEIAVSPDGTMYTVEKLSRTLMTIDKQTRQVALVGPLGFPLDPQQEGSLDFDDATGELYMATSTEESLPFRGNLYRVDTVTGLATRLGPLNYPSNSSVSPYGLSIANPGPECSDPADIPWLTLDGGAGTAAPGVADIVQARFDPAGLTPGSYRAELCVRSNDRRQPLKRIPVEFNLSDEAAIFRDSFDPAN